MITVEAIDHVVLRTSNLPEMIRFYSEVLGCAVERELPQEVGLVQLRAGNALIDLVNVDSQLGRAGGGPPADSARNMDHFCLQIAAISQQQLLDWLQHNGVATGDFETRYGATGFGPSLYLQDPEGNIVELRIAGTAKPA